MLLLAGAARQDYRAASKAKQPPFDICQCFVATHPSLDLLYDQDLLTLVCGLQSFLFWRGAHKCAGDNEVGWKSKWAGEQGDIAVKFILGSSGNAELLVQEVWEGTLQMSYFVKTFWRIFFLFPILIFVVIVAGFVWASGTHVAHLEELVTTDIVPNLQPLTTIKMLNNIKGSEENILVLMCFKML